MKITYDPRFNIAYIQIKEHTEKVSTVRVSEAVNVDLSSDGTVYGIELLNANEQLAGDSQSLIVVNEALGEESSIDLALSA